MREIVIDAIPDTAPAAAWYLLCKVGRSAGIEYAKERTERDTIRGVAFQNSTPEILEKWRV